MMSPPLAADDVSADAEMMLLATARNDAMFALHVPKAHIISEATSLPKAASFAQQGKHHSKKRLLSVDKRRFFVGDPDENRTRVTAVKGRCLNRLTTGPESPEYIRRYGSGNWI